MKLVSGPPTDRLVGLIPRIREAIALDDPLDDPGGIQWQHWSLPPHPHSDRQEDNQQHWFSQSIAPTFQATFCMGRSVSKSQKHGISTVGFPQVQDAKAIALLNELFMVFLALTQGETVRLNNGDETPKLVIC